MGPQDKLETNDSRLVKETGGKPGADSEYHLNQTRGVIAVNTGTTVDEVTPHSEKDPLGVGEREDFLQAVAGLKPEEETKPIEADTSGLGAITEEIGKGVSAVLPENEKISNVGEVSSTLGNEITRQRQNQVGKI